MNVLVNNEHYFKTEEGYLSNRLNKETGKYDIVIPTPHTYLLDHLRRHSDLLMYNFEEHVIGAFSAGLIDKDVEIVRVSTTVSSQSVKSIVETLNKGEF